MDDTHCGDKCPYKEMGFDKCPNEIETWWQPAEGSGQPKLVKDCAPKRMMLMIQQLYNRMEGVQKQQGEVCGQTYKLTESLKTIAQIQRNGFASQKDLEDLENIGLIEDNNGKSLPTISDSSS